MCCHVVVILYTLVVVLYIVVLVLYTVVLKKFEGVEDSDIALTGWELSTSDKMGNNDEISNNKDEKYEK